MELILGIIMFEDIFLVVYFFVVLGLVFGDYGLFVGFLIFILIVFGYMMLFFIIV